MARFILALVIMLVQVARVVVLLGLISMEQLPLVLQVKVTVGGLALVIL
jgi:hypothetical protein